MADRRLPHFPRPGDLQDETVRFLFTEPLGTVWPAITEAMDLPFRSSVLRPGRQALPLGVAVENESGLLHLDADAFLLSRDFEPQPAADVASPQSDRAGAGEPGTAEEAARRRPGHLQDQLRAVLADRLESEIVAFPGAGERSPVFALAGVAGPSPVAAYGLDHLDPVVVGGFLRIALEGHRPSARCQPLPWEGDGERRWFLTGLGLCLLFRLLRLARIGAHFRA